MGAAPQAALSVWVMPRTVSFTRGVKFGALKEGFAAGLLKETKAGAQGW